MIREASMYKKVVVPLDGSRLAEIALPHLEEVAKGCSIPDILLVSVTEKVKGRITRGQVFEDFVPEKPVASTTPALGSVQFSVVFDTHASGIQQIPMTMGKMAKTASDYLCKVAESLEEKGFCVTATVLYGNPAEQIVRYVNEQEADLIVMASTGKSKMSRWDMSNIAEKVVKETRVPVLLVKPAPDFKETRPKRRGVSS
jgi:nucleotide-binding universal stress UspA family protein